MKLFREGTQRYQHGLRLSLGGGRGGGGARGTGVHRGGGSCAGRVLVLPLVGGVTDAHYFAQKTKIYSIYFSAYVYTIHIMYF